MNAILKEIPWAELTPEELSMLRINAQICIKCGKTVGENQSKYCGDGSDKDNGHVWSNPIETKAIAARSNRISEA
jgi:hypothetical protein